MNGRRWLFLVFKACTVWTAWTPIAVAAPASAPEHFDESVNHAPPFQVYQKDSKLSDITSPSRSGALCWPSSLAHRMRYLQKYAPLKLSKLNLPAEDAASVRKFVELCHTSLSGGTSQKAKIPCIADFFENSGYHPLAFVVGPSARGIPASSGAHNQLRPVEISDLREYVKKDYGVVLHVGWLRYDPGRKAWREDGSHSLNVYGFDYDKAWGDDKIVLKVANPNIDYASRPDHAFFDSVTVSPLEREPGASYPFMVKWAIQGPGFNNPKHLAVVDDIYVFTAANQAN